VREVGRDAGEQAIGAGHGSGRSYAARTGRGFGGADVVPPRIAAAATAKGAYRIIGARGNKSWIQSCSYYK
jgi:hypothetical protein